MGLFRGRHHRGVHFTLLFLLLAALINRQPQTEQSTAAQEVSLSWCRSLKLCIAQPGPDLQKASLTLCSPEAGAKVGRGSPLVSGCSFLRPGQEFCQMAEVLEKAGVGVRMPSFITHSAFIEPLLYTLCQALGRIQ